jgi:hypothetical protein
MNILKSSKQIVLFCISLLFAINAYTKAPLVPPTTITGFSTPSDFNGHRYFKSTGVVTWKEAAKIADSLGGYLAIPNSLAEQTFIANYVGSTFHWLGLTDEKTEGTWVDVLGNTLTYFKWDAGQPENFNDEDYVHTRNGSWNDAPNSYILNFVIEFNGVETSNWTQISTITKTFTSNWTETLAATDPNKQYKLVVSGTWGIANGIQHRDAAYESPSTININTYFSNGNIPNANRACADGNNWYFNGACPPLVPTSPSTYSSAHVYEYLIGNGIVGGYPIAFTDANLGDNSGSLTYRLFESTSSSNIVTANPGDLSLTKVTSTKFLLNWTSNTTNPIKIYNIYRSSDNGINYTIVGKSNTTSYIDSNLSATTSYKYKVTEINKYENNNVSSAGLVNSIPFDVTTNDILSTITGIVNNATPSTDRFGINNSAYSFNGSTSSYIQYPNTVANMTQNSIFSFSFWAKGSAAGSVLSKYFNLDAGKSQFHITLSDIYGNGTGGAGNGDRLGFTPTLNTWDHYVVVLKNGTGNTKVYRNGNTTPIATGRLNYNPATSTTNLFVGRMTDGGQLNPLNGLVDDIKIYNRELQTTDVANLYNSENALNTLSESGFSNIATTNVTSKRALYVNKATGSNSNSGTNASPYATIQYALSQVTEGDTVIISDHTYNETLNITSNFSNIVIGSKFIQDGDTAHTNAAIIDAVNTAWASIHISSTSGLTFYGVTLKNAKGRLLSAAADTITFKNCKISNLGFNSSNITTNSIIAKNVYIDNTSVFNNVFIEGLITADSVSFTNSKFYSNQGGLIRNNGGGFSSIAAYIFNNSIFDNSRLMGGGSSMGDYFIHNVSRQIVIRNKIYRNNYMNILGGSNVGYQKVINNLFYNNSTSGAVARTVRVNSTDSLIMIHNTFINNGTDFTAHPNGFWPGLIYNNIFNGNITFSGPSPSGFDLITFKMKGNLFRLFPTFPQVDTAGSSENSTFSTIAFKDSANLNFTYADTEPRLGNAAVITYPINDDINGNPRPNPVGSKSEIGAFESPRSSVIPTKPVLNTIQTDGKRVTLNWSQANISGITKFKIYKDSASISVTNPTNFTTGLVAYYPFTGSTFDSSGKGNTLTSSNVSLTTDRFGNVNSAYNFGGTNSYMQSSVLSEELTNRTYSAWVNLSNTAQRAGGLVGLQSSDGGIFDVIVYNETNQGWGFGSEYFNRNKYSNIKETSTSTWAMLTATYEPNLFKLYRNGILIDSTKSFPITRFGTTSKINIGIRHNNGADPYLNGKIDDVRLYNRAISATDVANLYSYESKSYSERTNEVTIIPIDSVNSTIFTYTDNVSGFKKYFYRITAVNASGVESDFSNELSAFVYDTVTLVSPTTKSTNSIVKPTFTWTSKTNATKYRLQVSTDSTFATVSYADSIVTTNQFVSTKALNSASNYYWRVKAGDALGYSAWSSISSFQTLYISPSLDSISVKDNIINIKWSHSDVSSYNKFNVYRDTATITGTSASLPTAISGFNTFQDFNGHRYFKSTTNKTFSEARRIADSLGGYLAIPDNKAENDFLKTFIDSDTWIGVTDEITEGTWRDIFNNPLGYTNWNTGEPNNTSNNEDYASLIGFTTNPSFIGLWNDAPGTQNFKFIVEFNGTNPGQVLDPSLKTNLVAHYLFNGNVLDSSGTGANGTIIGGATLTTDRFGVANKAYSLNGSSQYIEFPRTVASVTTSKPYSISVWINQISGTNILGKYHNLDAGLSQFQLNTNSVIGNGTNTLPFANPASGWNHYVVILQSGTGNTKIYRNGVLLNSGTLTYNNVDTVTKFVVGRISDGGFYDYFNGKVDDIRVYNKVLTATDVENLYKFENTNPLLRVSSNSGVRLIASTAKNIFSLSDTLPNNKKYYYRVTAMTTDGKESDFSNELSATITPVTENKEVCIGADLALTTNSTSATTTKISTITKAMTSGWSETLAANNPDKNYKMVVSGTWGIANGVRHRDPAYSSTNSTVAITASNSNPVANRGCDGNWLYEGSCPPPVPSSPAGYSTSNTYEYIIGRGKAGGYRIAFSDGSYGDNTGALTFELYEVVDGNWKSDDPTIATVSSTGVVRGIKAGTTNVSYTMINGSTVTVDKKIITVNALPAKPSVTAGVWKLLSSNAKAMTAGWTDTLRASVSKKYKLVVSGTWGISNGVRHRDAAYASTSSSVAITSAGSNPVPNRGCDANWSLNGACPAPVPSSPNTYSTNNTYEYILGNGTTNGFTIAFSDVSYNDNSGSLTFDFYELVETPLDKICENSGATLVPNPLSGHSIRWYTAATGGSPSVILPSLSTSSAGTSTFYASQVNNTSSCESQREVFTAIVLASPVAPVVPTNGLALYQNANSITLKVDTLEGNRAIWYTSLNGVGSNIAPVVSTNTVGRTNYYVSQVSNLTNCESAKATYAVIVNALPDRPVIMQPSNNQVKVDTLVKFNWNKATGVTNYRLQLSTDSNFLTNIIDSVIVDTQFVYKTPLKNNTNYYWSVQVKDANRFVDWSNRYNFQTFVLSPVARSIAAISNVNNLVWQATDTANLNAIKIYRDTLPFNAGVEMDSILLKGLIAYYGFNSNATDSSTFKNNATVTGATLVADRFGIENSAYEFNGTSNYITVPGNTNNDLTSNYTISMWIYAPSGLKGGQILGKWGIGGTRNAAYGLAINDKGILTMTNNDGTSNYGLVSSQAITLDTWHHLVIKYSEDTLLIFNDNSLLASKTGIRKAQASRYSLDIGWEAYGRYQYFKGKLDDIRLYSRALSGTEISRLYSYENTIPTSRTSTNNDSTKLVKTLSIRITTLADTVTKFNTYYYRVAAVNKNNVESALSNELNIINYTKAVLTSPLNNTVGVVQNPIFSWSNANKNFKGTYRIQLSTDSTFTRQNILDSTLSALTFTLKNTLNTNTKYHWRVLLVTNSSVSAWSDRYSFTTNLPVPNFISLNGGNKIDTLKWSYSDTSAIKQFYIFRDTVDAPTKLHDSVASNLTTYVDNSKLVLNTKYFYRIAAVDKNGNMSNYSLTKQITLVNKKPIAAKLTDKKIDNAGEFNFVKYAIDARSSIDPDGKITEFAWYINDSLIASKDSILSYNFRQGTNEVKLVITDNDQDKDSAYADISITSFIKKFSGGFLAGIAAVSPNLIYTSDSTFSPTTGASVYLLNRSGIITYPLVVSSKVYTTPSVSSDSSVFITSGSNLYGFSKSGAPLWSIIPLGGNSFVTPTIDSVQQRLYVGVSNKNFFAVNYKTGKVDWNIMSDAPINSSAVITGDRKLIFTSDSGTLYGFDILTNTIQTAPKWKVSFGDIVTKSPAIDASNNIYIGTNTGRLIKLKLNESGTVSILWNITLSSPIQSSPVIDADGFVYVGQNSGDFSKINPANGQLIWTFNTNSTITSAPFINEYGTIYIANESGYVYAIDANKKIQWMYKDDDGIVANILYLKGMLYFGSLAGSYTAIFDDPNSVAINTNLTSTMNAGKVTQSIKPLNTNNIPIREPIWGTFQGNYKRNGTKPIDCPTKPIISSLNSGSFSFCENSSIQLRVSDTVTNFVWKYQDTLLTESKSRTLNVNKPGRYAVAVTNIYGCTINSDLVTVNRIPLPTTPIINRDQSGNLVSNYASGNKWYKDNTLLNDTTNSIKPNGVGNYTLQTTQNGCTSNISSAYFYVVTNLIQLDNGQYINLNPNPFVNKLILNFNIKNSPTLNVDVIDFASGRLITSRRNIYTNSDLNIGNINAGIYLLKVYTNDLKVNFTFKIVKL